MLITVFPAFLIHKANLLRSPLLSRQFLDAQLEVFIQLMTRLYNLGTEVSLCDAVQEYERSGRREVVQSTEKCKGDEVQKLTIK